MRGFIITLALCGLSSAAFAQGTITTIHPSAPQQPTAISGPSGYLAKSNNLSDLSNAATARSNLGLSSSSGIDTTNANNITSGTLVAGRLPAFAAGDVTSSAGSAVLSIVNGHVTAAKMASGAAVGNLGFTPANKAGDTFTGSVTIPTLVVSGTSTLPFTQTGTGAVARTVDGKLKDSLSILDFGADPTGVVDSTTAWNAAVAVAATDGRELYCSNGTYKITNSIVTSTDNTKTVTIRGPGGKGCIIQPTFSTGKPVIKADLAALCWNTQTPCLTVKGLYFDTPAGAGASTTDVIEATNQQYIDFEDNVAVAYRRGLTLTTSYSPRIVHNFHYNSRGSFLIANADQTMNNATIRENTITGSGITLSEPAFNVGPLSGQAVGMLFQSNNLNGNYGCWLINGLVSANFFANYCEASTAFSIIGPSTSVANTGLNFAGNVWSQNPTTNISAITNSRFDFENLFQNYFTFDSHTKNIEVGRRNYYSTGAFPLPTLTGGGAGAAFGGSTPTNFSGTVYEGATAVAFTITFAPAWNLQPSCFVQSYDGGTVTSMTVGATSLVVTPAGTAGAHFAYSCQGD